MDNNFGSKKLTRESAAALFLQNIDFVRSVAFEAAPCRSLLEDIVNDTYICLIENVDKWKFEESKKLAFLRSITEKMAARYWRSWKKNLPESLRKVAERIQTGTETGILRDEQAMESKVLALRLCLQKLSESNRELIELFYFGQTEYHELSKLTSKSMEALYTQMSRIRNVLYQCIDRTLKSETDDA